MAIKGKGRTRSRGPAAPGPRPVYVVPKKPFLARRGVQLGALAVLVLAIGAVLVFGFINSRSDDRLSRESQLVTQFAFRIEEPLRSVSQNLPPTGLQVFGAMRTSVTQLKDGSADPSQVIRDATSFERTAASAAESIGDIPAAEQVRNDELPISLLDTQDYVVQALRIYEQAAVTLRLAAEAGPGEERDDLIAVAEGLIDTADQLFVLGTQKLTNEQNRLGILQPQGFEPGSEAPSPAGT
jgi:hypothetical protein